MRIDSLWNICCAFNAEEEEWEGKGQVRKTKWKKCQRRMEYAWKTTGCSDTKNERRKRGRHQKHKNETFSWLTYNLLDPRWPRAQQWEPNRWPGWKGGTNSGSVSLNGSKSGSLDYTWQICAYLAKPWTFSWIEVVEGWMVESTLSTALHLANRAPWA